MIYSLTSLAKKHSNLSNFKDLVRTKIQNLPQGSNENTLRALISRLVHKGMRGPLYATGCFEIEGHQVKVKGHKD